VSTQPVLNGNNGAIRLEITTDAYPDELSYELYYQPPPAPTDPAATTTTVLPTIPILMDSRNGFTKAQTLYVFHYEYTEPNLLGDYLLVLRDRNRDGMCCGFGTGAIRIFQIMPSTRSTGSLATANNQDSPAFGAFADATAAAAAAAVAWEEKELISFDGVFTDVYHQSFRLQVPPS